MMRDELGQSFALLPLRSDPWILITKPSESRGNKLVCGRSAATGALSVERPSENELCRPITSSSQLLEPMVAARRLPYPRPSNNGKDTNLPFHPCILDQRV